MRSRSPIPGLALASLRRRALRSFLTALTAAVAVATVFATRGLLRGSEKAIEKDLDRLGIRTVQAVDGTGFVESGGDARHREPLGPVDLAAARTALAAAGVEAEVLDAWARLGTARPAAGGNPIPVPVLETGPAYARTYEAELVEGRFLVDADLAPGAPPVCVLDAETARALGGTAVGAEVALREGGEERALRVVGVLADPFRMRISTFAPDMTSSARRAIHQILAFRNVYVPRRAAAPGGSMLLLAVVAKGEETDRALDAVERALRGKERGLLVWSRGTWVRNIVETAGEQIQIANIVWAVVLAVALVMIATVTLVGVRERTAEVAVRRSQGATRAQVVGQLLAEGALLALAGGIAGIPLGLLAADRLATLLTWPPYHSPGEGAFAVALGVLVGLLAAALPAWRASRWDVVEGLRRGA
jgi:ABC-type antimicrobial peptide transport system permease subunit